MFKKHLDLDVCDDHAAIDGKIAAKKGRFERDLKSPDPQLSMKAGNWFKNAELLQKRRAEVLQCHYEAFAAFCDDTRKMVETTARVKLTALGPTLKGQLMGFARQNYGCDDRLADRFVADFQKQRKLPNGPDPRPTAPHPSPTPGPSRNPAPTSRKSLVVKVAAITGVVAAGAGIAAYNLHFGPVDYLSLKETILREHVAPVIAVAFSPDNDTLASGGADDAVALWDVSHPTSKPKVLKQDGHANAMAFSKDGKLLAVACQDTKVNLWNLETGELVRPLRGHRDAATSVAFSPDGSRVVSGGVDGSLRIWETESGELKASVEAHARGPVALAYAWDTDRLATGGGDSKVVLWDTKDWSRRNTLQRHSDTVLALAFSKDEKRLASASADTKIIVWNLETGEFDKELRGGSEGMTGVAFSPDGDQVIGAGKDGRFRVWDAQSGKSTGDFKNSDANEILALARSPNGRALASGSVNRTVSLWTPR